MKEVFGSATPPVSGPNEVEIKREGSVPGEMWEYDKLRVQLLLFLAYLTLVLNRGTRLER
jgi:hypothetical protein